MEGICKWEEAEFEIPAATSDGKLEALDPGPSWPIKSRIGGGYVVVLLSCEQ